MTYLLAVLAACANATSSVLQRKAGQRVSQRQNLSLRLIWSLVHEPVWFGGMPVSPGSGSSDASGPAVGLYIVIRCFVRDLPRRTVPFARPMTTSSTCCASG